MTRERDITVFCPYLRPNLTIGERAAVHATHDTADAPVPARARCRASEHAAALLLQDWCQATAAHLAADGAVLTLTARMPHRRTLAASDEVIARFEQMQDTLGEGPGITALTHDRPSHLHTTTRIDPAWPMLSTTLGAVPIGSVSAFPIRVVPGTRPVGTFTLYRLTPSCPGDHSAITAAQQCADTAGGVLAALVAASGDTLTTSWLRDLHGDAVNVAAGMMMVHFRISADEAITRMQAYAFVHDRLLTEVATDLTHARLSPQHLR